MGVSTFIWLYLLCISITISLFESVNSLHMHRMMTKLQNNNKYFHHMNRNIFNNRHQPSPSTERYFLSAIGRPYQQPSNALNKYNLALSSSLNDELIGEDSAAFNLENESLKSWLTFLVAVSGVLSVVFYTWIYDSGLHWGDQFKTIMESISGGDTTLAITYMLGVFAVSHSGLASLRPFAENIVGARVWRYVFALVSLPLAFSCIAYFINHRYDGIQLWDLRTAPWMHDFVWWSSLTSFLFLYPSTFNLLEVAAVDKPELHLWETGIARVTRHPQFIGQLIWCVAHTVYIGTSFMCATSAMLCAHHLFSVWNGDRRLQDKYGDKAAKIRDMTSVVPFAAIISGKQKLPANFLSEFLRPSYIAILVGSIAAYYLHPFMQAGAALTHW